MNEFDFIKRIKGRTPVHPSILRGIGDDCAVLAATNTSTLITTDMLMDGTDFILADVGAKAVGRKTMAVNLSDIAAMAGVPTVAVVAVALPKSGGEQLAEDLYDGLREVADLFEVQLAGGDTNSWNGPLVISATLLGTATTRGPVCRTGATPGDWIFVTGPLGGSILGRHMNPKPRIVEAIRLGELVELRAMIDISDGLSADLNHILEESQCGAVLDASMIPIHSDAEKLSLTSGHSALVHALNDGEDFELIFTVSPLDGRMLLERQPIAGIELRKIGECVEKGMWIENDGVRKPLIPRGWVHEL